LGSPELRIADCGLRTIQLRIADFGLRIGMASVVRHDAYRDNPQSAIRNPN
jgi:hypothetical protein